MKIPKVLSYNKFIGISMEGIETTTKELEQMIEQKEEPNQEGGPFYDETTIEMEELGKKTVQENANRNFPNEGDEIEASLTSGGGEKCGVLVSVTNGGHVDLTSSNTYFDEEHGVGRIETVTEDGRILVRVVLNRHKDGIDREYHSPILIGKILRGNGGKKLIRRSCNEAQLLSMYRVVEDELSEMHVKAPRSRDSERYDILKEARDKLEDLISN